MSSRADMTLCILWEDELRTAARLLEVAQTCPDEDASKAMAAAYGACLVALHGLADEKTAVMVSAPAIRKSIRESTP